MSDNRKGSGSGNHDASEASEGTVVRVDSRVCRVDVGTEVIPCRVRGRLFREERRFNKPVAVGDRVMFSTSKASPFVIFEVLPRRNQLSRPSAEGRKERIIASNLDQAVLVLSTIDPPPNVRLLDRMLVSCERSEFDVLIVINKLDLCPDRKLLESILTLYSGIGYRILETSVVDGRGIGELRQALNDQISVFAGMSGVGKSALLTAVQPNLALVSAEVSESTGKGRHTTTAVSLLKLEDGGHVVDTPGIRQFGVSELESSEIGRYFVEFRDFLPDCHFRTCTHSHEGRCAVKDAVDSGVISGTRYDSYLRILASLDD